MTPLVCNIFYIFQCCYTLFDATMIYASISLFLCIASRFFPLRVNKIIMQSLGSINIIAWSGYTALLFYNAFIKLRFAETLDDLIWGNAYYTRR